MSPGSTIAVEPATAMSSGRRASITFMATDARKKSGPPLPGRAVRVPLYCLSAKDGKLIWKTDNIGFSHSPVLGDESPHRAWLQRLAASIRELATGKLAIVGQ